MKKEEAENKFVELNVWAKRGRDSVGGIPTGYGMGGPWFKTRQRQRIHSSSEPSRPALGPTVPLSNAYRVPFFGVKATGT